MVDQKKAVVPYLRQFTDEEKNLLARMLAQVAPKANNDEKRLFLYTAQKKGLDPFDKQIYLVPRWDSASNSMKHSVQVSIDGLRLMAQRSGKYAGQTPYEWCGPDGKWRDVWISDEHPVAARVGILRHDFKEPLYSVALFKSYKQTKKDGTLTTFWDKFDAHMLGKCAEALSIRRAFPEETSGFYIPEEMGNPELVYSVEETAQDDSAPMAESEVVEDQSPTTETKPGPENKKPSEARRPAGPPAPSGNAPTTRATVEPAPKLNEIPSGSALRKRAEAMKLATKTGTPINWASLLNYALQDDIKAGKYKLSDLIAMKDELPPDVCAKIAAWLDTYAAAKKQAA